MRPLPKNPNEITVDWLTKVLQQKGTISSSGAVTEVKRKSIGEGVGMMSGVEILELKYSHDVSDAPSSLVIKYPTDNEANREIANQFNVYKREVRSFQEIVPQNPAASPEVYLADIEGDSDFIILLEDLSDYRLGDQVIGATLEESQLALQEVAKQHATFWGKVSSDEFEWMPRFSNSWNATSMFEGALASWETGIENFSDYIPQWIREIKDDFFSALPSLQAHLDIDPVTVVHGDFRLDNLFFGKEPHHHKVTYLDWQGPVRGKGIIDVAFLLSQSTQTEVRSAHDKELIHLYVDSLENQGVKNYTFDQAWEDYRVGVLYQWCFVALVTGSLDPSNERGKAWMTEMVKRNVLAIKDLNCLELL